MWWRQRIVCAHIYTHHLQNIITYKIAISASIFSPCISSASVLSLHNPPTLTLFWVALCLTGCDVIIWRIEKCSGVLSIAVSSPSPRCFSLTFWVAVSFSLSFSLPLFPLSIFQKENGQFCHSLFWWRGKLPNYLLNHSESFWRRCWFSSVIKHWLVSNFTGIFSWNFSLTKHAGHILSLNLVLNLGFAFCKSIYI